MHPISKRSKKVLNLIHLVCIDTMLLSESHLASSVAQVIKEHSHSSDNSFYEWSERKRKDSSLSALQVIPVSKVIVAILAAKVYRPKLNFTHPPPITWLHKRKS